LNNESLTYHFPDPELADEDGLLAIGGSFDPLCILEAYRNGIFPWYVENGLIHWYSLDPRCVLFPEKVKVSASMKQVFRKKEFEFSMNRAFANVIEACKSIPRKDDSGSWIDDEFVAAYIKLHQMGYAHSAECWLDGSLIGGLYGLKLGDVFYGESMFSLKSNASKFAFLSLVEHLKNEGVKLIDCQQETNHLMSLGADLISRKSFTEMVRKFATS
jgi:leucyl/phenylalanyl-tRNA--protein transferase